MICKPGDITVVPFPFVDSPHTKHRPAVVLSRQNFNESHGHTIMAMITTGGGYSWKSDIKLTHTTDETGLSPNSVIRMKLFTIDNRFLKKQIGTVQEEDWNQVKNALKENVLGL